MEILVLILSLVLTLAFLAVGRVREAMLERQKAVAAAYATMDALYRVRHDMIPGLTTSLRAHASEMGALLERLIGLRSRVVEDRLSRDPLSLEIEIGNVLQEMIARSESHPALQSDPQFRHVCIALGDLDAQILEARAQFNTAVNALNGLVLGFGTSRVARLIGLQPSRPILIETRAVQQSFEPMMVSFD
jgi:hypothetical protein